MLEQEFKGAFFFCCSNLISEIEDTRLSKSFYLPHKGEQCKCMSFSSFRLHLKNRPLHIRKNAFIKVGGGAKIFKEEPQEVLTLGNVCNSK